MICHNTSWLAPYISPVSASEQKHTNESRGGRSKVINYPKQFHLTRFNRLICPQTVSGGRIRKTSFSLKSLRGRYQPRVAAAAQCAPPITHWEPCEKCESEGGCYTIRVLSWFPCSARSAPALPVCLQSQTFSRRAGSKIFLKIVSDPPPPPQPPPLLYSVLAGATSRGWKSSFGVTRAAIIALVTPNAPSVSRGNQSKSCNESPSICRLQRRGGQMSLVGVQKIHFDSTCVLCLIEHSWW